MKKIYYGRVLYDHVGIAELEVEEKPKTYRLISVTDLYGHTNIYTLTLSKNDQHLFSTAEAAAAACLGDVNVKIKIYEDEIAMLKKQKADLAAALIQAQEEKEEEGAEG